jgi:hypothetical protein
MGANTVKTCFNQHGSIWIALCHVRIVSCLSCARNFIEGPWNSARRSHCRRPTECKKMSLCLTNYALCHEGVWGSGRIDPFFHDLGNSCMWVVSFMSRPLFPRGKKPQYPLDTRFGGPQSRSGQRGEETILDPTGTRTPTPQSSNP